MWQVTKDMIALREETEDLQADGELKILHDETDPFVFARGSCLIALNPSGRTVSVQLPEIKETKILYQIHADTIQEDEMTMAPQSFVILQK